MKHLSYPNTISLPYLADLYVVKKTRSKELAIAFLNHFLPKREESAEAYEYPMFGSNVEFEFENPEAVMDFMETNAAAEYSLYWRLASYGNHNKHAMIFYTPDGYMIFGISRPSYVSGIPSNVNVLQQMKDFLKSEDGYVTYECPPESNHNDFMAIVKQVNASR